MPLFEVNENASPGKKIATHRLVLLKKGENGGGDGSDSQRFKKKYISFRLFSVVESP